jgi:peptidoglycan/LPS O-acetylase OafA/YrhL
VGVLPIAVAYSFGNLAPVEESLSSIPLVIFGPLFLFLMANRWLEGVRLPALVSLVSTASYFMYLFHRPIFRLFTSGSFPDTALGQLAVLLLICLPVTVLLSWQGQLLYDRWVRQLDRPAPSPAG